MDLSDIDLLDLEAFAGGVPYGWFAYLRAHAPVYRHPEPDGPGFWVISRHSDVRRVGQDFATFSSAAELGGIDALVDDEPATLTEGRMLPLMDPPDHTRYRQVVRTSFRPPAIRTHQESLRSSTIRALDDALEAGSIDFIESISSRLPSQAIASMLGLPDEDCRRIVDWSSTFVENESADAEVRHAAGRAAYQEIRMYARELADDRLRRPRDDVLTTLATARVDGERLSEEDFASFVVLLATAGDETTRNSLAHAMIAFAEDPSQLALIRSDPTCLPTAVEEVLRWATPALYFRRTATSDSEIRGVPIQAGDKVSLWYISANRDEEAFREPNHFDVRRSPNEHLAFGHGPHFCLGVHLARTEIRIFLEELAKRVSSVEIAGDVVRLRSNAVHGIKRLPIRLIPDPKRPPADGQMERRSA